MLPFALVLLVLLSGCAYSLEELRASPVVKTERIDAPYAALSVCTKRRVENATGGQLALFEDPGAKLNRLLLRGALPLGMPPWHYFEFSFIGTSPQLTTVELRHDRSIDEWSPKVWPEIMACQREIHADAPPQSVPTTTANPTAP